MGVLAAILALLMAGVIVWLLAEQRWRKRSEAESEAILSSAFADIAILGPTGEVERCNENWLRAAATADPFVSARIGDLWMRPVPQPNVDDLARIRDAFDGVVSGRTAEELIEYRWNQDTEWRWAQLRLRRMGPTIQRVVVAHLDITARKRIEGEAHAALQELAHMNMRAGMGEIVAAVTHELTQSLTASLSNAQALRRRLAQPRLSYDDLPPIVDDIRDANRQASDILNRIRSLMRKEALDIGPLDLNAIVTDVVQVLNSSAANDGVLLVADLAPGLPPITGDRVQVRQVVMNLIINAVHATRGHHVGSALVRVSTGRDGSGVVLRVDDPGSGVPEDALPRLFEPYYTTKKDGLGVGLSISRSIVQSHGGSIEVANLPQGGARFVVHFPVD